MPTSTRDAENIYLIDESAIESQNDRYLIEDGKLQHHVHLLNSGLEFIDSSIRRKVHESARELIVQRLAIRCFNSGAAAIRLARSGYYQQCLAIVRDIVETSQLLDLFEREPKTICEWAVMPQRKREQKYSPFSVRLRLETLDQNEDKPVLSRDIKYKQLCTYGTHPTPEGFVIISPNMMTIIGPFPDQKLFKAMIEEITQHFSYATIVIASHIKSNDVDIINLKSNFFDHLDMWVKEFNLSKAHK